LMKSAYQVGVTRANQHNFCGRALQDSWRFQRENLRNPNFSY